MPSVAILGGGFRRTTRYEGGGVWWASDAVLDADFANARFRWDGVSYTSLSTWLAAIGGVNSSGLLSIGPYVDPAAPELVTNGDFANGLTGWTATQIAGGPASADASTGEGVLNGNAADSPALYCTPPVQVGRAYQGRGKVKRGATLSPQVRFSTAGNMGGGNLSSGANQGTTNYVEQVMTMTPWASVTAAFFGMRAIVNPANGTAIADDFSLKECAPFKGFVPTALSGLVQGVTPAAASGSKVIWQTDDGAIGGGVTPLERNYIRLYWASDKHLHLLVTYQATAGSTTTQADLDLGVVEVSTAFRVAFSCAPNSFIASLDGQPSLSDTSGTFPGAAVMRFGKSQTTSNNWDGTISRATLYASTKTAEEVENLAAANVASLAGAWGDSLTAGTGASGNSTKYPAVAAGLFTPDRAVANKGVGGETSTQIKTRMVADSTLRRRTAWIWAGRNNYTDPTTVKADIAAMVASLGHDRYLIGSIINGEYANEYQGQSSYNTMIQLNADLAALYGSRYVDVRTPLVAEGAPAGSVPNATDYGHDIVPSGLRLDNIHLLDAGYAIVAQAFYDKQIALGW